MTTSPTLDELSHKLDARFDYRNRVVSHSRKYQSRWWGGKETWTYSRDLGVGAFGVVWLEEEATTQQLRAVKRMTLLELTSRKIDFRRELQTLIALRGYESLFVQFLGWYHDENFVYFAMGYVAHGDLEQYIQHSSTQARANAKEITRQLLEGLVVLHSRQICHRDLKPQNVLIAALTPIHVKLADFGVSKCTTGSKLDTQCGTPGYQAPELLGLLPRAIYRGTEYTDAVDMWALGCLLYQILTTEAPFLRKPYSRGGGTLSDTENTGLGMTNCSLLIDMNLFHAYCSGTADLPTEKLRPHVTDSGLGFFKQLLVPDPRSRMSATEALNHKWMFKQSGTSSHKNVAEATQNQSKTLGFKLSREITERRLLEYSRSRNVVTTLSLVRLPSLIENIPIALFATVFRGYTQVLGIFFRPQHFIEINTYFPGQNLERTEPQAMVPGGYFNAIALILERGVGIDAETFRDSSQTSLGVTAQDTWLRLLMQCAKLNPSNMAHTKPVQPPENEPQLNFIYENPTTLRIVIKHGDFGVIEILLNWGMAADIGYMTNSMLLQIVEQNRHSTVRICFPEWEANDNAELPLWSQFRALTALQVAEGLLVPQSGESPAQLNTTRQIADYLFSHFEMGSSSRSW